MLGEAEDVINDFFAAWQRGRAFGVYHGEKFQVDVTKTPMPRFDLLRLEHYLYIGVQYSRGCPFNCEFCDIIELYGRVPRTKTNEQMLAELDRSTISAIAAMSISSTTTSSATRRRSRIFLPDLQSWQEDHGYPFEFSTEASINLADDDELLAVLQGRHFCASSSASRPLTPQR